ncbi:MAG TPA: hypothetical protein DD435_02645 [Cyanobacteria bacterium UBA8530]|nr:hypothetical protein [Cyanobacteria bacterium UBA8530]
MKKIISLFSLSSLLGGCALGEADSTIPVAARQVHANFIMGEKGFGLDPSRAIFYESFENGNLDRWLTSQAGASGDTWRVANKKIHFGASSLTYGQGEVIGKAVEFGEATLATKEVIALQKAKKPVLILFALFDRQGAAGDRTAFQAEASNDLGFHWDSLKPIAASDPVIAAADDPSREWMRFRYDLTPYAGQPIRLRLNLRSSLSNRKLLYLDDILVAESSEG